MRKTKVVFRDENKTKTVIGTVSFSKEFVIVTCDDETIMYVNKKHIVFMREAEFQ